MGTIEFEITLKCIKCRRWNFAFHISNFQYNEQQEIEGHACSECIEVYRRLHK